MTQGYNYYSCRMANVLTHATGEDNFQRMIITVITVVSVLALARVIVYIYIMPSWKNKSQLLLFKSNITKTGGEFKCNRETL